MLQSYHLDSMSPEELREFYNSKRDLDLDPGAAWRQHCIVNRIEHLVKLRIFPYLSKGFKVLDYGCGSGFTASYLRYRFGWDTVCYDPYTMPPFSPNKFFRDWEEVVRNGAYHLVIASEVFEHFRNPKEQITQIGDILVEDYAFVFLTTGLYVPTKRDQAWQYLAPQSGQHVCFYSRGSIEEVGRLLKACRIYQVGAEYEWLFVRSHRRSGLSHAHLSAASALLRTAVSLGILRKIE